jgi:hypothetical protein
MTWGYEPITSGNTIRAHGKNLASALEDCREDCEKRPIIFIAHGLEGLVCEVALLICGEYKNTLYPIVQATKGIIFMGRPHGGAAMANWGTTLTKYLKIVLRTNATILRELRKDSQILKTIQE